MMWEAIGGLALIVGAGTAAWWATLRYGIGIGYERHRGEQADTTAAEHRRERDADDYTPRHQLQPWPDGEPFEKLATTGELRVYAETGDIGSLERENAAFWRIQGLRDWTRVKA
jgi:hypothetical protein